MTKLKIHYDDVIFNLQSNGGISTVFRELIKRMPVDDVSIERCIKPAQLSRLLTAKIYGDANTIFHSTYYRVPHNKFNGKVVTTVHDFIHERYWRGWRRQLNRALIGTAIAKSDAIICVSKATKSDLHWFYPEISEEKVKVIYNGVSDQYCWDPQSTKRKQVIYVGSRAGYKNFNVAISVVRNLPGYTLVIVGGGPLVRSERELLDQELTGRFRVTGNLPTELLKQEYNASAFLIYPSEFEGFGIPPLEAMKCGCPVIATNVGSISEICGSAALLVDDTKTESFIDAAKQVLVPSVAERLAAAGFKRSADFSWSKNHQEVMQVYKSLV